MLKQYGGRRTTIAAVVVVFITIFALLNILEPFSYARSEPENKIRLKETAQLGEETFTNDEQPADALIDSAKAALEEDAAKSEEEKQAEAEGEATSTRPEREFPTPAPTDPSKVVVMGKLDQEETNWVHELSPDWSNAVYCVDKNASELCPTGLKTKMNKAKEAMPYLTYIIDHYTSLPDVMAFVHAHRNGMPQAWHNDAPHHDAVRMLQSLKTETVLERGYVNLRCISDIGCPDEVQPFRDPPDGDKHAEHAYPHFYAHFFDATLDQMREEIAVVGTPCCAQFAVSREEVLKRDLKFYERVRQFLETTHYDDDTSGRVMEYMWHIIFGREAVSCEDLFECWCKVYGRCGLTNFGERHWKG